jgi:hypothetical protein
MARPEFISESLTFDTVSMMTRPEMCRSCSQDLVMDCAADHSGKPCLIATIHKFVLLAGMAGLSCDDLLDLLRAGLTPAQILEWLILQVTTAPEAA